MCPHPCACVAPTFVLCASSIRVSPEYNSLHQNSTKQSAHKHKCVCTNEQLRHGYFVFLVLWVSVGNCPVITVDVVRVLPELRVAVGVLDTCCAPFTGGNMDDD